MWTHKLLAKQIINKLILAKVMLCKHFAVNSHVLRLFTLFLYNSSAVVGTDLICYQVTKLSFLIPIFLVPEIGFIVWEIFGDL